MLCTIVDNFYLTDEELSNSPSRQDGVDEETETILRIYGAQMIQEAGILLQCHQAVMATAQVLLQRFYCKKSLREYNVKVSKGHFVQFLATCQIVARLRILFLQKLAAAAIWLAVKLEECTKVRIRDVIMVFDRLWRRREGSSLTLLEPGTRVGGRSIHNSAGMVTWSHTHAHAHVSMFTSPTLHSFRSTTLPKSPSSSTSAISCVFLVSLSMLTTLTSCSSAL